MKNIRQGVFETNSSSSHSISISKSNGLYDTLPVVKGTVTLKGGEFGWEEVIYYDALTKANYAAVDCQEDEEKKAMLIEVIKEHTGAKKVNLSDVKGYIDHQSYGTSFAAFQSKQLLKEWLFSPDSYLQTDNDNH